MNENTYKCQLMAFSEDSHLQALRHETKKFIANRAHIQIARDQAQFLKILIQATGSKNILEIGTFCGYSALAMAQVLPDNGQIITCDINEETTDLAQRYWQKAKITDKIKLMLGPAIDSMQQLKQQSRQFDIVFIDANEEQYVDYFNLALQLVHSGGIIIVDNVLALNGLLHTETDDKRAKIMLAFNQYIAKHSAVDVSIIPVGGGMALCYVR